MTSEKVVFCNTFLLKQGTSKASKGKISTLEFPELLAHVQNPTDSEGAAASYQYWIKPLLYFFGWVFVYFFVCLYFSMLPAAARARHVEIRI